MFLVPMTLRRYKGSGKQAGEKYVGCTLRIDAAYFDDVKDVTVASDFFFDTVVSGYIHADSKADRRWIFFDHTDCPNHITEQCLKTYKLIDDDTDEEYSEDTIAAYQLALDARSHRVRHVSHGIRRRC